MGIFVANKCLKLMTQNNIYFKGAKALILGFAFKENCNDYRNTKVIDIVNELADFGMFTEIYDPLIDKQNAQNQYKINFIDFPESKYDLIIHAVSHDIFKKCNLELWINPNTVIFDVKGTLTSQYLTATL